MAPTAARSHHAPGRPGLWAVALAAGLVTAYLAAAALGPVTNYDSGLYHLGAISYAGDYATIPGLADIYQAFGYNTSEFPFAAFLGNGPWDGQGFRMASGLIVTVMSADLVLRFAARRQGDQAIRAADRCRCRLEFRWSRSSTSSSPARRRTPW